MEETINNLFVNLNKPILLTRFLLYMIKHYSEMNEKEFRSKMRLFKDVYRMQKENNLLSSDRINTIDISIRLLENKYYKNKEN